MSEQTCTDGVGHIPLCSVTLLVLLPQHTVSLFEVSSAEIHTPRSMPGKSFRLHRTEAGSRSISIFSFVGWLPNGYFATSYTCLALPFAQLGQWNPGPILRKNDCGGKM